MKKIMMTALAAATLGLTLAGNHGFAKSIDWAKADFSIDWAGTNASIDWAGANASIDWAMPESVSSELSSDA